MFLIKSNISRKSFSLFSQIGPADELSFSPGEGRHHHVLAAGKERRGVHFTSSCTPSSRAQAPNRQRSFSFPSSIDERANPLTGQERRWTQGEMYIVPILYAAALGSFCCKARLKISFYIVNEPEERGDPFFRLIAKNGNESVEETCNKNVNISFHRRRNCFL